ncbi:unnamed protein product [Effrenium voratum]|nr:unnamed protein product [Effrenium voratum]
MFIGSHVYNERICLVSRIPFLTRQIPGPQVCEALSGLLDRCCCAGVRVVILRSSSGQRVWSAGHDVRDFKRVDGSPAQSFGSSKFQDPLSSEDSFVKLLDRIRNLPVPVIASIEGTVWGGATDICACCDVLICTPKTTFAITPAKIGLPYNHSGMSHFIQVMPLHIVKWMFFSGEPITAEQALQMGFVNFVVPVERLEERTAEMANTIASRAPLVVHLLKRQLLCMSPVPSLTPEVFEELHEKRKKTWCSYDMEESGPKRDASDRMGPNQNPWATKIPGRWHQASHLVVLAETTPLDPLKEPPRRAAV